MADHGSPNVRAAAAATEVAALVARVHNARVSCEARSCSTIFDEFGLELVASQVVMARTLGQLHSWVANENQLLVSYHSQVRAGRLPQDNHWDRGRTAAESTISPNYYEQIQYACLSLDQLGPAAYGQYHIVFKEPFIVGRTSLFEENPFEFCKRHKVTAGQAPPLGYRATWSNRTRLAQAKLHTELLSSTKNSDFPSILVKQGATTGDVDVIEAHIHGDLHRNAIMMVSGPMPKASADRPV